MKRDLVELLGILVVLLGMSICGLPEDLSEVPRVSIHTTNGDFWSKNYQCGPHFTYSEEAFTNVVQWTPDGSFLLLIRDEEIWTVDAGGTHLQRLVNANRGHESRYGIHSDVSPGGVRVVYATCEYAFDDNSIHDDRDRTRFGYEVGVINIDGTGKQRLTANAYLDHFPVWSPDGRRIAFVVDPHSTTNSQEQWNRRTLHNGGGWVGCTDDNFLWESRRHWRG